MRIKEEDERKRKEEMDRLMLLTSSDPTGSDLEWKKKKMETAEGVKQEVNLGLQANALYKTSNDVIVTQSKWG